VLPLRLIRWVLTLSITVFFLWGSYWLFHWFADARNFPLEHVVLEAPYQHVPKKLLDQHINPYVKKNFVTLDAAHLQQELQKLPWVKKIQVRRVWPDTLVVKVIEQQASARWSEQEVVNPEGDLFHADAASIPENLPQFRGPRDMVKSILKHYQQFQLTLNKEKLKIKSIQVNPRNAWEVQLEDGPLLILGQSQHQERLALIVKAWSSLIKGRTAPLRTVDARYPNGIAVVGDSAKAGSFSVPQHLPLPK
jgi:cell division protein FtsQ